MLVKLFYNDKSDQANDENDRKDCRYLVEHNVLALVGRGPERIGILAIGSPGPGLRVHKSRCSNDGHTCDDQDDNEKSLQSLHPLLKKIPTTQKIIPEKAGQINYFTEIRSFILSKVFWPIPETFMISSGLTKGDRSR